MKLQEQLAQRGIEAVRREYGDGYELVADFGPAADISVDVVDGTVIVVTDGETHDIDVGGSAQAFIKNGVLTITVTEDSEQ
jgi:hypothetical protein